MHCKKAMHVGFWHSAAQSGVDERHWYIYSIFQ